MKTTVLHNFLQELNQLIKNNESDINIYSFIIEYADKHHLNSQDIEHLIPDGPWWSFRPGILTVVDAPADTELA